MNPEKTILLHFDKFTFPVTYSELKTFICAELNRLSKVTGYSIKNLKLEFKEDTKQNVVAYFSYSGDCPIGFCFFLKKLNNTSPNEIIDVCRHEFAHFVVCMQNAGHQPKDAHGTKWKKVCGDLGARPSTHIYNTLTRHLK